jgi:two-component system, NtrC family, sensor kinase
MKRRSKAGGEAGKSARHKSGTTKRRRTPPKALRGRGSATTSQETEIARLTRERDEAREQQTALSELLRLISRSKFELQPILQSVVDIASHLCRADVSVIFRLEGGAYRFAAGYSLDPAYLEHERRTPISPGQGTVVGRAAMMREVVQIEDSWTDPLYEQKVAVKIAGGRSMIGVPLMREGEPIGVMGLARIRVEPFTQREIELVTTFADQAVIAIENARLFEAEQQRTRELTESLEQQTATSEVLQVISSSPGDLQPVFTTILANAARICDANFGNVYLWDGEAFHLVAAHNTPRAFADTRKRAPFRPNTGHPFRSLAETKQVFHVADIMTLPIYQEGDPQIVEAVELGKMRTCLGVPMLKDNNLIGAVLVFRQEVRLFTANQIALITNFAAQAVIAIENARLLRELRERTDDLSESLHQQTATSNVLKVISRSAFDLQGVFDTLISSAVELSGAFNGTICLRDGDGYRYFATAGIQGEFGKYLSEHPPTPGRASAAGRVLLSGEVVSVPDVLEDPDYIVPAFDLNKTRSILGVPLLRQDKVEGALVLARNEPGLFTRRHIDLVQSFADQAVIAIENVRLFNETKEALERAHLVAFTPTNPMADEALKNAFPLPLSEYAPFAFVQNGEPVQFADTETAPAVQVNIARARGFRSILMIPLMNHGTAIRSHQRDARPDRFVRAPSRPVNASFC